MRVLVTGAGGFIGTHLVAELAARGHRVRACTSAPTTPFPETVEVVPPSSRDGEISWDGCVSEVDVVVHLAARAHVLNERSADPLAEFRRVNVRATQELARQAERAGARQFVFVSSIGVNGSSTSGAAFSERDPPAPTEWYAISKWEAEQALRATFASSSMSTTVLRLPLVYGAGVKGNFLRLLRMVHSGIPLPLGSVRNSRSYLHVENFCDFVAACLRDPQVVAGQLFLLADGEDVSTPVLIATIAAAMERPARLIPFPPPLLRTLAAVAGKGAELKRLTGSLQIDAEHARRLLDWAPPKKLAAGISQMAHWYLRARD